MNPRASAWLSIYGAKISCQTQAQDQQFQPDRILADAMIEHGIPEYIRSDNGP